MFYAKNVNRDNQQNIVEVVSNTFAKSAVLKFTIKEKEQNIS